MNAQWGLVEGRVSRALSRSFFLPVSCPDQTADNNFSSCLVFGTVELHPFAAVE